MEETVKKRKFDIYWTLKRFVDFTHICEIFYGLVLHKAGRHMEDSMVAAYVGLLIGYIVMKNRVRSVNNLSRGERLHWSLFFF